MSYFHLNSKIKSTRSRPDSQCQDISKEHQLKRYASAVLGGGNLQQAVYLPEGENSDEWIAANTVDFYNQVNMLYSTITEFCSPVSCPTMTAGPQYEYLWPMPPSNRPVPVSAPRYMELLMTQVQGYLDDTRIFPSDIGVPFSKDFLKIVKTIWRRISRVYGHIYCCHFPIVCALGGEMYLNTSFKHFVLFADHFDLIDKKEFRPLQELIDAMLGDKISK